MTTPTPQQLKSITRNWYSANTMPCKAAEFSRHNAEVFPKNAEWHLAVAAEWDRIAAANPDKVAKQFQNQIDHAIVCLARMVPGSALAQYWQDRAAEWDLLLLSHTEGASEH